MKDYNIENLSNKINSEKTRLYFKEVSNSFYNGNYRAAIVTLYSVVINDILVKLEVLEEIYNDNTAKDILDEIRTFQSMHPNSPDWEKDIIEKVKIRTNLIDNVDYAHIQALKNDRHLCAHPVLDKEDKLYTPNQETVAAHIRNMLESLFLKPAILSKKILQTILVDIASKKDILIDELSVERYILSKYLNNLNSSTEVAIFRELWKFVFTISNNDADSNRLINYRVLYYLYKRNIAECISKIKSEKEYFSNILNRDQNKSFFIRFLSENEFLYTDFREDTHLLISNLVKSDFSSKVVAWFLSGTFLKHLEVITEDIKTLSQNYHSDSSSHAYQRLVKIGIAKGYKKEVIEFIIWRHTFSRSYDEADKTFTSVILPNLNLFDEDEAKQLCEKIDKNHQNYGRIRAYDDYEELKYHLKNFFGEDFDFSIYPRAFK